VINLKTTKVFGPEVPTLLARADKVKLGVPASSWLHDDPYIQG
jgi:hypothetical protein